MNLHRFEGKVAGLDRVAAVERKLAFVLAGHNEVAARNAAEHSIEICDLGRVNAVRERLSLHPIRL